MAESSFNFYIVDDEPYLLQLMSLLLKQAGHHVSINPSSKHALADILDKRPDIVLLDLMMPELDGMELCRLIRNEPTLDETKVVIVSAKNYEFDRRQAKQFGANGYLTKPIKEETFLDQIYQLLNRNLKLTYWGVRGTQPIPGPKTVRYGGNTICVSLEIPNEPLFIFDAGTGMKQLSDHLVAQKNGERISAKIFLTHPHWDHIQSLPFFSPLFGQGNEIEILGSPQGDLRMNQIVRGMLEGVYFPITMREFSARVFFRDLYEESLTFGQVTVDAMLLNHPGNCLGYRVTVDNHSICYMTDQEIYPLDHPNMNRKYFEKLVEFVQGTDILIPDTTYMDDEYPSKMGWGHSGLSQVVALAHYGNVKALHLFHHDTEQMDEDIDRKLAQAQEMLNKLNSNTKVIAPREQESFIL